jgi:hypothetical protein
LHLSQGCFEKAQRRRALARALRLPGPVGTGRLAEYLEYLGQARPVPPGHARTDGEVGQGARASRAG